MLNIPLEDDYTDIIGKAMRGRQWGRAQLAERAGVGQDELGGLLDGHFAEEPARRVARVLELGEEALVALGRKAWYPEAVTPFDGLACYNTPYGDMFVNAFLVWDPASGQAAAFDTGSDATPIWQFARANDLRITDVYLTHIHGDHIHDLARLVGETGANAWISSIETVPGAAPFEVGRGFSLGALAIETRRTSGHTRGGTTYVVRGLARPLAIVGDAMFAGSMGGGLVSYADALKNNREQVLTLPDDTVICPGHGPLSSVAEAKRHNPFFPEFARG